MSRDFWALGNLTAGKSLIKSYLVSYLFAHEIEDIRITSARARKLTSK